MSLSESGFKFVDLCSRLVETCDEAGCRFMSYSTKSSENETAN